CAGFDRRADVGAPADRPSFRIGLDQNPPVRHGDPILRADDPDDPEFVGAYQNGILGQQPHHPLSKLTNWPRMTTVFPGASISRSASAWIRTFSRESSTRLPSRLPSRTAPGE